MSKAGEKREARKESGNQVRHKINTMCITHSLPGKWQNLTTNIPIPETQKGRETREETRLEKRATCFESRSSSRKRESGFLLISWRRAIWWIFLTQAVYVVHFLFLSRLLILLVSLADWLYFHTREVYLIWRYLLDILHHQQQWLVWSATSSLNLLSNDLYSALTGNCCPQTFGQCIQREEWGDGSQRQASCRLSSTNSTWCCNLCSHPS